MSRRSGARYAPTWVTVLLVLVGVVLAVVAVVYFADTAAKLPSFFPGHLAGSVRKHTKHGLAAAAVAVVALIAAWISTGRKRRAY